MSVRRVLYSVHGSLLVPRRTEVQHPLFYRTEELPFQMVTNQDVIFDGPRSVVSKNCVSRAAASRLHLMLRLSE